MISRGSLALLLVTGCATAPVVAAGPVREAADDLAIDAELPAIEAAARRGEGKEAQERFAARTDEASKVLAAWANPDLQLSWNKFHALSTFNTNDVWTDIGVAHVYLEWKTLDQAAAALERALARNPRIAEAHVLKGQLLRLQGQLADAAAEEQKALELNPGDPFAMTELGQVAQAQGNAVEARQHFADARKVWPDDYVAARALAELDVADPKTELADLDELHRLAPQDMALWLESGRLRAKGGDLPGAAHDFEEALKGGAHDPDVLGLLAKTYREQGRVDDERRVLSDLVSQKADAEALRRLADLELKAGNAAAAMKAYKQAVAANAKDADSQLALARLSVTSGTLTSAIGDFRAVVGAKPEAKAELEALEAQAQLARTPIQGSIVRINSQLGSQLNKLYRTLLEDKPALGGAMRIRVVVKADGTIAQEEFLEDTVGDPKLAANLFWNAHDAHYPPGDKGYVFKFDLKP